MALNIPGKGWWLPAAPMAQNPELCCVPSTVAGIRKPHSTYLTLQALSFDRGLPGPRFPAEQNLASEFSKPPLLLGQSPWVSASPLVLPKATE